jgi:hypothetical protein
MVYVIKTGPTTYWKRGDNTWRENRARFSQATRFKTEAGALARAEELRARFKRGDPEKANSQITVISALF